MRDEFLAALKSQNTLMKNDNKAGHQWRYTNKRKREKTFQAARKKDNRYTNCVDGVQWALKTVGVPSSALQWYGSRGIVWCTPDAEREARKYFDIIKVKTKTVKQCVDSGILQPGDVLTYTTLSHTNAYYSDGRSFDSGHAYCEEQGEDAKFIKWIGSTPYKGYKVAYILRLKEKVVYRVQVGAYTVKENAEKRCAEVKAASGYDCFIENTDMYRAYCGSFENKKNAEKRAEELREDGIENAFVTAK